MKGLTFSIFKRVQSDISTELTFMPRFFNSSKFFKAENMMESTKWQQVRKYDSISG